MDIVSSKITKFLLVNTGYNSIEKLEDRVEKLEKDRKDLMFSCKGAVASATTAGNKVDELKRTVKAIEKKLKTVEAKTG